MEGQLGWAFEANVIFLSGVVNTSSSRGIDLMSKLGDNFPSITVSSRFPLPPDNLLSAGKGIDLGFSVQGLFFCGELFLLDKVELALLLSLLFGRTDARGRGALGGQVRQRSGEERSRSGV